MTPFRKKLLIHSAVFFGLVLVFGFALFFVGKKISASAGEIQDMRKQLYDWIVSLESFAAIRTEYTMKAERYLQILDNRLPEKELLIDLKKDLQFLAGSEKVGSNLVFNQDLDTQSPRVGAIGVTLSLSGGTEEIIRFIGRLNEIRYLISIESMTFTKKEGSNVDVQLKGRVFYKKPQR